MNGAVERCNGAWRYEFYETYDLPSGVDELNPHPRELPEPLQPPSAPRALLPEKPQPSISPATPPRDPSRLTCADPMQGIPFGVELGYGTRAARRP